jgi:LPLT family lysophospholipid transporter-like MFS transporter
VGVVVGAGLAGKFVTLDKPERALTGGVLIGVAVCVLAPTTSLTVAFVVMAVVGTCGGFFVVPLNALLQEQGHKTVGAGHAVAVQNLAENSAMLLMIGLYTLTVRAGAPVTAIAAGFGAALSLAIGILWLRRRRLTRAVLNAS